MQFKKIISWIIIVCIILLLISIVKNSFYMLGADKRLLGAQEKVDSLNKQKNQLIYAQEESQSLAYLERQIRDKLKMVQPGETLVVLPSVLQEKVEEDVYKYHTQADYQSKTSKPWQEWWLLFQ